MPNDKLETTEPERTTPKALAPANGYAKSPPPADVLVGRYPLTTTHQVWINRQLICGTDQAYLADIVRRALDHWWQTENGKEWWRERRLPMRGLRIPTKLNHICPLNKTRRTLP